MTRSVLLHASGTWTPSASDYQLLETFDMGCIRSILNVSLRAHQYSADLRRWLTISTSIRTEVTRNRLRSFGHVARMEASQHLPRLVFPGAREKIKHGRRGRPATAWLDLVDKDLEERGFGGRFGARPKSIESGRL